MVACALAGAAACLLRVEYALFFRHADFHAGTLAALLVQHALRTGGAAAGGVLRGGDHAVALEPGDSRSGADSVGMASKRRPGHYVEGVPGKLREPPRLDAAER